MGRRTGGVGLAAAAVLAAASGPAAAAPLAAGPVLPLSAGGIAGVQDVAVTDAGDALAVIAVHRPCCAEAPQLVARGRRGARGPFGPPVRVAVAPNVVTTAALGGNGDAYVAFPRDGSLRLMVRRGWGGRWNAVVVPYPAGAIAQAPTAVVVSDGGRTLDLLWAADRDPGPGTDAVVRSARLRGTRWTTSPDGAFLGALAAAPGGAAVTAGATADGRILASARPRRGAAWDAPVELAHVRNLSPGPLQVFAAVAAGRDGSRFATWSGAAPGADAIHVFVARRRPGTAAWDAPADLGTGVYAPSADASRAAAVATAWPVSPSLEDEGPSPQQVLVAPPGGALAAAGTIPTPGAPTLHIDEAGRLVIAVLGGLNTASSTGTLWFTPRAGAALSSGPTIRGDARAFAAGEHASLLVGGSAAFGTGPSVVGVDDLGPLGLAAPARARAGGSLVVRLELWRRTRVTLRLAGGPAQASVTRTLPRGRSVVPLAAPRVPGRYLLRAVGREPGGRAGLRQSIVVRVA